MKPIFDEEIVFLKRYGITVPKNCWRKGSKIYANGTDKFPIMEFVVDEISDKIILKKNFIKSIDDNIIHVVGKYRI